jgi:hypothetical protein
MYGVTHNEYSVENGPNFRTLAILATAKLMKGKEILKLFQEWGRQYSGKCKVLEGQK